MREHGVREEEGMHNWAMRLYCLLLLESAVKLVSGQRQRNICWHCGDCCWNCWTKADKYQTMELHSTLVCSDEDEFVE